MNEVVTYIVTIAPSLTAILTVIISLLTMINRISKIVVNIHKDNEQLKDFSIITFKHRYKDRDLGTIGIIGPKRMDYSKVVSVMKYINKKLKDIEK